MRLDIYLTENSLCKSRTAAQSLIKSGGVSLNGIPCTKPSQEVGESDTVDIIGEQLRYVGRGGLNRQERLPPVQGGNRRNWKPLWTSSRWILPARSA